MNQEENLCPLCGSKMVDNENEEKKCPWCGYDSDSPNFSEVAEVAN